MNAREEYQQIKQKIETLQNYNFYALGLSGAGKTHFIPCMYHHLILAPRKLGFIVASPNTDQQEELEKASEKLEIGRSWLPSTVGMVGGDPIKWTFTCRVPQEGGHVDVFQFTYIDYPGGTMFNRPDDEGVKKKKLELRKKIQDEADVLFGFIDGETILGLISEVISKEEKDAYLKDLRNMLEFMQNTNKPVHFVITKWDMLCRENISLLKIKKMLLRDISDFRKFVDIQLQTGAAIRLIPVSAVGMNFVDPQSNVIRTDNDVHLDPINIEIPLLYATLDTLIGQMRQLKLMPTGMKDKSALLRILRPVPHLLTPITNLLLVATHHQPIPPSFQPSVPLVVGDIEREIDEGIQSNQTDPDINYQILKKQIYNKRRILHYTIKKFFSLTRRFEKEFPGSRLEIKENGIWNFWK